jgi:hypothetical protein
LLKQLDIFDWKHFLLNNHYTLSRLHFIKINGPSLVVVSRIVTSATTDAFPHPAANARETRQRFLCKIKQRPAASCLPPGDRQEIGRRVRKHLEQREPVQSAINHAASFFAE